MSSSNGHANGHAHTGQQYANGQQNQGGQGGTTHNKTKGGWFNPTFNIGDGGGGGQQQNGGGRSNGGGQRQGQGRAYSPLADPEFFTNSDVRDFCENGRAVMTMLGFDIAMAAEVLEAVLKEIPDPEGRPWGSKLRARRVAKRLAKTADHLTGAAKNFAATYAAFQREFSPELEPMRQRQARAPRRSFDFNS